MDTTDVGDGFEAEVTQLYRLMGYKVERNVRLVGQQLDIVATRDLPGAGRHVVLVECKYKGGGRSAGNEEIQSIAGAYITARTKNLANSCAVVTNTAFTLS